MLKTLLLSSVAALSLGAAQAATYNFSYTFGTNTQTDVNLESLSFVFEGTLQGDGNTITVDSITSVLSVLGTDGNVLTGAETGIYSGGDLVRFADSQALLGEAATVSLDGTIADFSVVYEDTVAFFFESSTGGVTDQYNDAFGTSLTSGVGLYAFPSLDEYSAASMSITPAGVSAVPLPAAAPLLLAGVAGLAMLRRRA